MGGEQYICFVQPFQKLATSVMTDHNENKQGIRASGCTDRVYKTEKLVRLSRKLICVLHEAVFGSWMGDEWNIPPDEGVVLLEENDTLNRGLF